MDAWRREPSAYQAALLELPPWSELDDECRSSLLESAQRITADRNTYLDINLGIVDRGAFAIERALSDGRRILAALYHEGEFVDFRPSVRIREGRLVAVASSEMIVFEAGWIDACMSRRPPIGHVIKAQLHHQQSRLHDHIADLAAKTPLERVASMLFEFRRWPERDASGRDQPVVRIPMRRTDIADYLGMKPETLSRAVRSLEQERLIRTVDAGRILMADVIGLRRIANGGRPRRSTRTSQA